MAANTCLPHWQVIENFGLAMRRLHRRLRFWFFYSMEVVGEGTCYVIRRAFGDDGFIFIAQITKDNKLSYETNSHEADEKASRELSKFCQENGVEIWDPKRNPDYYNGKVGL